MSFTSNRISSEIYAEAATYLGNRRALRKEVEMFPDRVFLLEAQTDLMSQVSLYRGMLWSVELRDTSSKIHLFALSHTSLQHKIEINRFIHPVVIKELVFSQCLYVETQETDILSSPNKEQILETTPKLFNRECCFLSEVTRSQAKLTTFLGLDKALTHLATQCDIEIRSLESVDDTFSCLKATANILNQVETVSWSEGGKHSDGELVLDSMDAIQSGNFEQMCDVIRDQLPELNILLQKRNPKMVEQMIRTLEASTPAFFAIGAAHFVGIEGLLALLSKDQRIHISRIGLP